MALSKTEPTGNIYKFQLVQFILRGPKTKLAIDIVPLRWIDTKNGKTAVTKFMPPPYTSETNELLHSLTKADAEAPANWSVYPIEIKGQANTYDEAVKKLDKLKSKPFVFTTDSDVDPATKAEEIEKKIIRAKKYGISEETRHAMVVPPMDSDSPDDPPDLQEQLSSDDKTSNSSNDKHRKARQPRPKFLTKPRFPVSPKKKNTYTVSNSVKPQKANKQIQRMPPMVQKQVSNDESLERETDKSGIKNIQKQKKIEYFAPIVSILEEIAINVKEVLSNQNIILMHLNTTGNRVIEKKFAQKHSLSLPFQNQPEFIKFNEKLHIDDEFRKEFITSLDSLFDRELTLSKSLTNICKKYLSRDVAMKYTVLRRVPGKSLLKDTMFYDCVLGVVTQTHKDRLTAKKVTEQVVDSALGRVMNNAKDWDGQRLKRATSESVKETTVNSVRRDYDEGVACGLISNENSSHDEESTDEDLLHEKNADGQ